MAVSFPTSLDAFTNPTASDRVDTVSHSSQHSDENDAIEALEGKVGVNSSAVVTSLDYLVKNTSSSNPGHKHTLVDGASDVSASATELNYSSGVTSAIQTQILARIPTVGSSTDNAVVRFNGTTGGTLQASSVIIDDSDNISGIVNLTNTGSISTVDINSTGNLVVKGLTTSGSYGAVDIVASGNIYGKGLTLTGSATVIDLASTGNFTGIKHFAATSGSFTTLDLATGGNLGAVSFTNGSGTTLTISGYMRASGGSFTTLNSDSGIIGNFISTNGSFSNINISSGLVGNTIKGAGLTITGSASVVDVDATGNFNGVKHLVVTSGSFSTIGSSGGSNIVGALVLGAGTAYTFPTITGTTGQILQLSDGNGTLGWASLAGGGDVSAASNITDNRLVRGDGGVKGVQESGITCDDSNNLTGITSMTATNGSFTSVTVSGAMRVGQGSFTSLNSVSLVNSGSAEVKDLTIGGNVSLSQAGDTYIYFNNGAEYLLWDDGGDTFFFSDDIGTNGSISGGGLTITGSSSVVDVAATGNFTGIKHLVGISGSFTTLNADTGATIASASITNLLSTNGSFTEITVSGAMRVGQGSFTTLNSDTGATITALKMGGSATAIDLTMTGHLSAKDIQATECISFDGEYAIGEITTTPFTINWTNGNKQGAILTGTASLINFTAPPGACNLVLKLTQGTATTLTWNSSVKWPSGTAPTLSTTANDVDIITFYYDGTSYYGVASLDFS